MRNLLLGLGVLAAASTANAQLVVGFDDTTAGVTTCYAWDFNNPGAGWQPLFSDRQVWGLAADDTNGRLYIASNGNNLYYWDYSNLGTNTPPTLIGTFMYNGAAVNFVGLAYNPNTGKLYGTRNIATEAIYEINPLTAEATLLFTYTAADFSLDGLDYNPADGMLYGADDTAANNSGLFRIDIAAQTITFVTPYPAFQGASGDVDGLAIGELGGSVRAYFVIDNAGETGIYNLTTGQEETPMSNPWTTSEIFSGGAWAATLFAAPTGSDVRITKTDSPDPVVPPGGNITYTVTVTNNGPEPATGVAATDPLPENVTFVSVTPPGVFNNGTVSAAIGDLAVGASVSFDIVVTTQGAGPVSNTATVTSTSPDNNQTNNSATATTTVRNFQADLSVAIVDPADCSVPIGATADYTLTVGNAGPEDAVAAEIAIVLPANADFIGSNPPGTPVGNVLTLALGDILASGSSIVTMQLSPNAGPSLEVSATVSSTTEDPSGANNSDAESMLVAVAPPTSAAAKGVFSTVPTSPTSEVPGFPGLRFSDSGGIDRPFRSPNGQRWIVSADTDNATTTADQMLMVGSGTSFAVVGQEGITLLAEGDAVGTFDTVQGINDAGQYTFSTNSNGATTTDEVIVKWDGSSLVTVAREGGAAAGTTTGLYGVTSGSATIAADGTVSFYTTLTGTTTTTDSALYTDDGATLLAWEGVTIPAGQDGGATFEWDEFDSGTTDGIGFFTNADASRWSATGDTTNTDTNNDKIAAVDGTVVIQENVILAGSGFGSGTDMVSPINYMHMESDGTWFAYGDNNDDQDWVLRNGAVIAATDTPIHTGSAELWDDAPYAQTYYFALGNTAGDYVVGGTTNAVDGNANAVIVLNGEMVLSRENDPVDLDANGVFDDGVYISVYRDDYAFMTTTELWIVARLRDEAEALCGAGDNDIGQALIRIPLPTTPPGCPNPGCDSGGIDVDFDNDCQIGLTDLSYLLANFGVTDCPEDMDIDGDGDCDGDLNGLAQLLSRFGNICN